MSVRKIAAQNAANGRIESKWQFADDVVGEETRAENDQNSTESDASQPIVEGDEVSGEPQLSKSKKRRLKKLKKKRNQAGEDKADSGTRISWGGVTEHLFTRQIGLDAVPKSGCYPLGLGEFVESVDVPLDEHVSNHQVVLKKRMQEIEGKAADVPKTADEMMFETRQWDFKRRVNNPLFKALREPFRAEMLQSLDTKQSAINEMKHQLDKIRSAREATKCSCKPMKSVDKLSVTKLKQELTARGFSEAELGSCTKPELMKLLRERIRGEPLCNANNCECFRQGVECHFDICGCCHKSTQTQQCGNPFGKYEYDGRTVNIHRKRILFPDTWMTLIAEDMPRTRPHADSVISHADSVISLPDTEDGDEKPAATSVGTASAVTNALNGSSDTNEQDDSATGARCPPDLQLETAARIPSPSSEIVEVNGCSNGVKREDGVNDDRASQSQHLTQQLLDMLRGSDASQPQPPLAAAAALKVDEGEAASADAPRCRAGAAARGTNSPRKAKVWKLKEKPSSAGSNGRIHQSA